jgi:ABC-type sugar transport system ATPase subunit
VRKLPAAEIAAQVKQTAALLEIEALLARRPRELSGGERQRVALARAIVRHPKAFLMDEPLSNLDAKLRLQMRGELKRLQHKLATTTVYVTHDQAEAMTLGHRVAVMNRGKLQQCDTPLEIYNRPANRFVAEFVGSPSMNLVDGEIDGASRTFKANDGALHLVNIPVGAASGPVTLGVRPENIQISTTERDGWWPVNVYVTELMGNETFLIVEIGKHKIIARAASDFRAETGSSVWIDFDFPKAHWFNSQTGMRL